MCRELTPWKFIVNCLFAVGEPININDLWEYTSLASKKVQRKFPGLEVYDDHYSIEEVIYYKPLFLKIDLASQTITLDTSRVDDKFLENIVNYDMDDDIKRGLPELLKETYKRYAGV